jgi:hypothetical protein
MYADCIYLGAAAAPAFRGDLHSTRDMNFRK